MKNSLIIKKFKRYIAFFYITYLEKNEYKTIFGKEIKCPRRVYRCGDNNLDYKYSSKDKTDGWIAEIKHVERKIEKIHAIQI